MLGNTIGRLRRQIGLTQEMLAQQLDVTNQAVSKWETDQCCPDVALLPRLADILGVTLDELFGREVKKTANAELPWANDDALYIAVFAGHTLLGAESKKNRDFTFYYEGPAKDIHCNCNVDCGDVAGNVKAGGCVDCSDVGGNVEAGSSVDCSDVAGHLNAGSYVECGDVEGNLNAGSYVECGDVGGSIQACGYIECADVNGNVTAGGYTECGDVGGDVTAGDYVECGTVGGKANTEVRVKSEKEDSGVKIEINGTRLKWNPFEK